jgi:formiminotetrahydrofolate cyclodeaminase
MKDNTKDCAMLKLVDLSVTDLLTAFRSSDPTPGGGSASALAGAVGAALLTMAAGLPKPHADSAADIERLHVAGARCCELSGTLLTLIDRDSEAYTQVMAAYRMAKTTEAERKVRSTAIQATLRSAIEAPLDVIRACGRAIGEAEVIARFANRNAATDVQVGLELLAAALRGARANVDINLQGVKDPAYTAGVLEDAAGLDSRAEAGISAARGHLQHR